MDKRFFQFTDTQKGIFAILGGLVLLLYALNATGYAFNIVVIIVSVAIILYGLVLAEVPQKAMAFVKRLQGKR